jgi:hypothetical protein
MGAGVKSAPILLSHVLLPPCGGRTGMKKLGLSVGQEYLQSFTNAVIWEAKVTRLCNYE